MNLCPSRLVGLWGQFGERRLEVNKFYSGKPDQIHGRIPVGRIALVAVGRFGSLDNFSYLRRGVYCN
jgi:hypothetical protein